MKVALLSFHNAYNYGAALQAYALQEAITGLEVEAEYIDYANEHRVESYNMILLFKKAIREKRIAYAIRILLGIPFIYRRKQYFDRFYAERLQKTDRRYSSSLEAEALNPLYDRFIVGSDQVWNPSNNGNDTAYLLDFVQDEGKCISYSPSFGVDQLPDELCEKYSFLLSRFCCLGVREMQGQELVRKLTGKTPAVLLDPVFLINRSEWEKMLGRKSDEQYIFYYTNDKNEILDFQSTKYNLKGSKSHILCTKINPIDYLNRKNKMVIDISVYDFLSEIYYADLVVTSSFHCLAFSIIFHKQFVCVLSGNAGKDERLINLMNLCGLEDRILTMTTTEEDIKKPIDYHRVDNVLEEKSKNSLDYLRDAIFIGEIKRTPKANECINQLFCQDDRCTGCGACAAVCHQKAISMVYNLEGYLLPKLSLDKCINCGLCHDACQVFKDKPKKSSKQSFWAVINRDAVRDNSSSGGVFSALAAKVLHEGGVVAAAEMNSDYQVQHTIIQSYEQIDRIRGTFYVQSNCWNIFSEVREYLDAGREVLFVGTPCQVYGLKCYLKKDYNHLILCDLLCHGVPGQGIFDEFISFLKSKGELQNYRFRDKELGWRGYTETAIINKKKYSRKTWLSSYDALFSKNQINRRSCAQCSFSNLHRCGDITIGDLWTVHSIDKKIDDNKGVSLVICNTQKGFNFFQETEFPIKREISQKQALQNSLIKPSNMSKKRLRTLRMIHEKGYGAAAKKYGINNLRGRIRLTAQYIIQKARMI